MSSSFFLLIRKLKNANVYARELARQYALFRSVSDQVDNPRFKAYSRLKNYRLVVSERPMIHQGPASQYENYVPPEGVPPGIPPPEPPPPVPGPSPPAPPPGIPPPGPIVNAKFAYADAAIDANGSDGINTPAKVNDGSLATRWSYNVMPSWIRVNLGTVRRIAYVRMAIYRGNERRMGFTIETSNSATSGFVIRYSGTTSGETTGFETWDFTDVNAQYVIIRFTSNTQDASYGGSLSELEIWGGNVLASPPPPAPPGTPPPGPAPPPAPGAEPVPAGTVSMMFNFSNTIDDSSGMNNHATMQGTLRFAAGATSQLGQALDLNPITGGTGTGIPTPLTSRMKYFGGPILNKYNVEIYNIWWGSAWNSGTPASDKTALQAMYTQIVNSDWFKGFWQYGGVKTPVIANNNVVHTATALPSGTNATFIQINTCIDACVAAGQVPNYRNFGEPAMAINTMDYRHLYIVHMPQGKLLPAGFNGASAVALSVTPPHLVWYNWSAINPPAMHENPAYPFTARQMAAQAWAHEIVHHLESPYPSGCGPEHQGYSGWNYNYNGECGGSQHSLAGCGGRVRALTGTTTPVASYWSDQDGKCIAPGTGDTWKAPPTGGAGTETYDKIWVPFSNTNRVIIGTNPGFSVFCRIYPYTLAAPPGANNMRCIWQKLDDRDNGATANIGPDGTLYFSIKKDNVTYRVRTAPNAVTTNAWFQCWFTYEKNTNAMFIYVNNVRHNLTSTVAVFWNAGHSHFIIGNYGLGSSGSPFRGRIDDFRLYRNGVVNTTHVQNIWQNQFTIETIPIGSDYGVGIVGFSKVDSKQTTDVFVTDDVEPDAMLPVVTPPPPPPGTDDIPQPPKPTEPDPTVCTFDMEPS